MMTEGTGAKAAMNITEWNRLLRPYVAPSVSRSLLQLAVTLACLVAGYVAMVVVEDLYGYWAALPLAVPTGLIMVRLFTIQHDCGHHSFFRQRWACDWVGRTLGLITWTPYLWWKRDHDWHHSIVGDLSRRGFGDIDTLTVREYKAMSPGKRLVYRIYRHPLLLLGFGPLYQFLIRQRFPIAIRKTDRRAIWSILGTDLALLALLVGLESTLGLARVIPYWLPVMLVATTAGVWVFLIQHQFRDTYWAEGEKWDFVTAALKGCSYYKLPKLLEWMTCWINYHHVHHLSSRIPNYHLRRCYRENPALHEVTNLTIGESLGCAWLALWDEDKQQLVSFREAA
jgi:omega-6 fatty acid desaturase (delta-12 desaturase)